MSWTFAGLTYTRPDVEAFRRDYTLALEKMENAKTYEEAKAAYREQDALMSSVATMATVCRVRNTIDSTDTFYEEEQAFIDRAFAEFIPLQKRALEALVATPFRAAFAAEFGEQMFIKAELEKKTQSEAIVQETIEESELKREYSKTIAQCKTDFRGETCNFYGLLKYMESADRETRRDAFAAWAALYESISDKLDGIYDKLIAIRLRISDKLGFENYTALAYANMGRTDYSAADVANFRKQVKEIIVPAVDRYRKAQAKRIGVDTLKYYDENFMFPDGNADPVGGEDVLIPIAVEMYRELSPETGKFFDFMVEHHLYDLESKQGKRQGGYCTYLPDYKAPFIFSNFNGTAADTGVLTHEAGHAFAFYTAGHTQPISEYFHTTSETAEIHSMTMEHFTYPWLNKMFGEENAAKAKFTHLVDAFSSIPYLVSVDEYQHRVYEKPDMTAKERRAVWKEIEQAYMPWRDYDGVSSFLEEGGFWMQKQHIFMYPFYYIDYALAQVCAFEFYGRMKQDKQAAWADYLRLCQAGGSQSYFGLLKVANLSNPFAEGTVQRAVGHVIEELDAQ